MIRSVDLVSYLPPFLQEFRELSATLKAEDPEFTLLWEGADRALENQFIETADEYGIARFEKILKILPSKEDTIETRRVRVQNRWFTDVPYTIRVLIARLTTLCGADNFKIVENFKEQYDLIVQTLGLSKFGQVEELDHLLETMIPCNLVVHSENKIAFSPSGPMRIGMSFVQAITIAIESDPNSEVTISGNIYCGNSIAIHQILSTETSK